MAKEKGKRKKGRKTKKDPNKPKRGMSSFMYFAKDKRQEIKDQNPELKVTEIGKKLGELWKTLSPAEKQKYEDQAAKDQERYKTQMKSYTPPESDSSSSSSSSDEGPRKKRKKSKKKKDPNKPKRGMSSFMFFSSEKRNEVRAKFPEMKMTDIGKKVAELWKALSPDEKKKYEELAAKDNERYKAEMQTYKPQSAVVVVEEPDSSSESSSESESSSSSSD